MLSAPATTSLSRAHSRISLAVTFRTVPRDTTPWSLPGDARDGMARLALGGISNGSPTIVLATRGTANPVALTTTNNNIC